MKSHDVRFALRATQAPARGESRGPNRGRPVMCPRNLASLVAATLFVASQQLTIAAAPPDANAKGQPRARLTDDERAQLKQLRADLDAGTLTPQAFATQVDALLGDRFSGH